MDVLAQKLGKMIAKKLQGNRRTSWGNFLMFLHFIQK